MSIVGSVVAFVTARKIKKNEMEKKKKKKKRLPVPPPTEIHVAKKGTGYNRSESKRKTYKDIKEAVQDIWGARL